KVVGRHDRSVHIGVGHSHAVCIVIQQPLRDFRAVSTRDQANRADPVVGAKHDLAAFDEREPARRSVEVSDQCPHCLRWSVDPDRLARREFVRFRAQGLSCNACERGQHTYPYALHDFPPISVIFGKPLLGGVRSDFSSARYSTRRARSSMTVTKAIAKSKMYGDPMTAKAVPCAFRALEHTVRPQRYAKHSHLCHEG